MSYSWNGWLMSFLAKCKIIPNAGAPDHATQKIFKVSGGWVVGAGDYNTILNFVSGMGLDIWDKPYWDYHSTILYVTKLGKVYKASSIVSGDDVTRQDWVWESMVGKEDGFFCFGSGYEWALEAYSIGSMKPESAIKYAAKHDPFTNDIVQCNIDLRDRFERWE